MQKWNGRRKFVIKFVSNSNRIIQKGTKTFKEFYCFMCSFGLKQRQNIGGQLHLGKGFQNGVSLARKLFIFSQ